MSDRKLTDKAQPSLEVLTFTLRNKALWPAGFIWDYHCAETCAIGLSEQLWPQSKNDSIFGLGGKQRKAFGLGILEYIKIFYWGPKYVEMRDISPEMIADMIDEAVARKVRVAQR